MNKSSFFSLICAIILILHTGSQCGGQILSGSSLNVSGTGTVNTIVAGSALIASGSIGSLAVTGTADILADTLYFGSWETDVTQPGLSVAYSDGNGGMNSNLTQILTRPLAVWKWQRLTQSGSVTNVMQIDAANRLILTGSALSNPPKLILDPNGEVLLNGSGLLTQNSADKLYASISEFSAGVASFPAEGSPTIALGGGVATGAWSLAGIGASASGCGASAIAYNSIASGTWSVASGVHAIASGYASAATGAWSTASGNCSTASGNNSVASGGSSTANGLYAKATGGCSSASGPWSVASGNCSTASGYYSNASGGSSTANGPWSTASGDCSMASGYYSTAVGKCSTAAGAFAVALGYSQYVIGQYNIEQGNSTSWVSTDDLFIIGNGTGSSVRSNAVTVKKNGDTCVYGKLTVTGTNNGKNSISNGGLVITGAAVQVISGTIVKTKVVASGSNQMLLLPEQGDLSMGDFINGTLPQ